MLIVLLSEASQLGYKSQSLFSQLFVDPFKTLTTTTAIIDFNNNIGPRSSSSSQTHAHHHHNHNYYHHITDSAIYSTNFEKYKSIIDVLKSSNNLIAQTFALRSLNSLFQNKETRQTLLTHGALQAVVTYLGRENLDQDDVRVSIEFLMQIFDQADFEFDIFELTLCFRKLLIISIINRSVLPSVIELLFKFSQRDQFITAFVETDCFTSLVALFHPQLCDDDKSCKELFDLIFLIHLRATQTKLNLTLTPNHIYTLLQCLRGSKKNRNYVFEHILKILYLMLSNDKLHVFMDHQGHSILIQFLVHSNLDILKYSLEIFKRLVANGTLQKNYLSSGETSERLIAFLKRLIQTHEAEAGKLHPDDSSSKATGIRTVIKLAEDLLSEFSALIKSSRAASAPSAGPTRSNPTSTAISPPLIKSLLSAAENTKEISNKKVEAQIGSSKTDSKLRKEKMVIPTAEEEHDIPEIEEVLIENEDAQIEQLDVILHDLVTSPEFHVRFEAASKLQKITGKTDVGSENTKKITEAILKKLGDDGHIVASCCSCLANLAGFESQRSIMKRLNALPSIVVLLNSYDLKVIEQCLRALYPFANQVENCKEICKLKGLSMLRVLVHSSIESIRKMARLSYDKLLQQGGEEIEIEAKRIIESSPWESLIDRWTFDTNFMEQYSGKITIPVAGSMDFSKPSKKKIPIKKRK